CAFESVIEGLTTRLRREGLAAIVVGRDGGAFGVADWPNSATFRRGDQSNLLITDNQSRSFMQLSPARRQVQVRMTWGDRYAPTVPAYPDIGIKFVAAAGGTDLRAANVR